MKITFIKTAKSTSIADEKTPSSKNGIEKMKYAITSAAVTEILKMKSFTINARAAGFIFSMPLFIIG